MHAQAQMDPWQLTLATVWGVVLSRAFTTRSSSGANGSRVRPYGLEGLLKAHLVGGSRECGDEG